MSMVHRLIEQLKQRGLSVEPGAEPDSLLLCGPNAEKTPEVFDALRKFKPALLKIYRPEPEPEAAPESAPVETETCRVCEREVEPQERELLKGPVLCDRAGSKGVTDGNGRVHPPSERCPYKPTRGAA